MRLRHILPALAFAALTVGAALGQAAAASASTQLCTATNGPSATVKVAPNYYVMTDEWASTAPMCISTDGNPDFAVTQSAVSGTTVGAYPNIGTTLSTVGLPVRVSAMGDPTTSWSTTPAASGKYDTAYDLAYSTSATSRSWVGGAEVMIWLNKYGNPYPAGPVTAPAVSIGGVSYDVHVSPAAGPAGHTIVSFIRTVSTTSVTNLDLGAISRAAALYGNLPTSLYLYKVQAGFEIWQGGAGLATTSFSYQAG